MSAIWYDERNAHLVTGQGEIYEVTHDSRGPFLQLSYRGISLTEYVGQCAGQFSCRIAQQPLWFCWIILDVTRRDNCLPDAVFIPKGVNHGLVFNELSACLAVSVQ